MPETENYALNKKIQSGAHTDVYVNKNVNDGKTDTYWESKGFPAEMVIDLGETHAVTTVAVCLNPSSIWEPRIQEIAVWVSADGESYHRRRKGRCPCRMAFEFVAGFASVHVA